MFGLTGHRFGRTLVFAVSSPMCRPRRAGLPGSQPVFAFGSGSCAEPCMDSAAIVGPGGARLTSAVVDVTVIASLRMAGILETVENAQMAFHGETTP